MLTPVCYWNQNPMNPKRIIIALAAVALFVQPPVVSAAELVSGQT